MNHRRILGDPSTPRLIADGGETESGTDQCPLSSAARADFDQTIKPDVIFFDSLGQSVLVRAGLVNAISLVLAYLYGLARHLWRAFSIFMLPALRTEVG
jgi:hypothetical protein